MKKYPISLEGEQFELALVNLPPKKSTHGEALKYIQKRSLHPAMIEHLGTFQEKHPLILKNQRGKGMFIFALGTIEKGAVPYLCSDNRDHGNMGWWDTRCNNFPGSKKLYFLVVCGEKTEGYKKLENFEAKKREEEKMREEKNKVRWPGDVSGESKTKMRLIKEVLDQATPFQLLAVRQYLKRFNAVYGYDSIYYVKEAAEKAFDNGDYGNPNISYLIREDELLKILQDPTTVTKFSERVRRNSVPPYDGDKVVID